MARSSRFVSQHRCRLAQIATAVLCVGLIASGCSSDDSGSEDSDSASALASSGEGVALQSYRRLAETSAVLEDATVKFCDQPGEASRAAAQAAYVDTRLALSAADAFWVGPAEDERSRSTIDPEIVAGDVDEAIGSIDPEDMNAEYVSGNVGATKRGLGAIEQLLYSVPAENGTPPENECLYLEALAGSVALEAQVVLGGWEKGDDIRSPYIDVLADPDHSEMITADLLNSQVFLLRGLADMQLAPALGLVGDPDAPSPESIVEGAAGLGAQDIQTQVQAIRDVLVGPLGDEHFAPVLGDELSGDIVSDTAAVVDAAERISGPLRDAASETDPADVKALYDALVAMEATLSTQVVDVLGVTVGFSDADGDGAS